MWQQEPEALATSYPQLGNTEGWFYVPVGLPFSMCMVEDSSKGIVEYSVGHLPTSLIKSRASPTGMPRGTSPL